MSLMTLNVPSGSSTMAPTSPKAANPLERTALQISARVTRLLRIASATEACGAQQLVGEMHPPPGKVLHRCLPKQGREPFRKHGTRHARLTRKRFHPPTLAGRTVQCLECAPDAL